MCEFGIFILGGSWKISSESVVLRGGLARRNLSPTRENYLGTAVRALRA